MQTRSKILEDLSKVAQGATQSLVGVRAEIDALIKGQLSRILADMDLVEREEFDAVKAMAQKAREENGKLQARIETLEARLKGASKKAPAKTTAKRKTAAKKPSAKKG
jgi:BMFP domain-containing protein YqiC